MTEQLYQDTLSFLYEMLPMYQRNGNKAVKKSMENIQELCWEMGSPQWKFQSIHVGGTNGKGSVSSMLTSVLLEAGYKVGTYTSPHLVEFTERIRINGREISKEAVVEFVECYKKVIEKIRPSFFELTAAMAFEHFAEQEVDIALIEVGLGGRLDSTNIIRPEMSIITNVSYDHMEFLGDTLESIATEKAGIIKPYTPVVIGERQPESSPVFSGTAKELDAPLFFAEDLIEVNLKESDLNYQVFEATNVREDTEATYQLDLLGEYQLQNLRTVLAGIEILRSDVWEISDEAIASGLKKVRANSGLRGRMEQLHDWPQIWCDTGHNLAGVSLAMEQVRAMECQNLHIVWGMVKEKSHQKILSLLPITATYYFVRPDIPRGLPAHTLQIMAEANNLNGEVYDSVPEAVQIAIGKANPDTDLIFIGGSTFVVADLLRDWDMVLGKKNYFS